MADDEKDDLPDDVRKDMEDADDTDADELDDDGQGKDDADWKPPTKDEWKAIQTKLTKSNKDAQHHRTEAQRLKQQGESDAEKQVREAVEQAETQAEGRWKSLYVKQAAKAALAQAGLIGKPDRLLKLIDMDDVTVDEDGSLVGLDAQVRELRQEYRDLFSKRGGSRVDGAGRDDGDKAGPISSATQRLLAQSRG